MFVRKFTLSILFFLIPPNQTLDNTINIYTDIKKSFEQFLNRIKKSLTYHLRQKSEEQHLHCCFAKEHPQIKQ